jgi:hypothetical protein
MKTSFSKSNGQGNLSPKLGPRIFEIISSIVSRLQSTTLTGRGIQIQVHQHFGYKLHLVWDIKNKKRRQNDVYKGCLP